MAKQKQENLTERAARIAAEMDAARARIQTATAAREAADAAQDAQAMVNAEADLAAARRELNALKPAYDVATRRPKPIPAAERYMAPIAAQERAWTDRIDTLQAQLSETDDRLAALEPQLTAAAESADVQASLDLTAERDTLIQRRAVLSDMLNRAKRTPVLDDAQALTDEAWDAAAADLKPLWDAAIAAAHECQTAYMRAIEYAESVAYAVLDTRYAIERRTGGRITDMWTRREAPNQLQLHRSYFGRAAHLFMMGV